MKSRIRKFISRFADYRIDAFLVTNDINISYLTDYPSSDSWLLVLPNKAIYLTDFRYTEEIKKNIQGVSVFKVMRSLPETFSALFNKYKLKRIGFDERHVSVSLHKKIKKNFTKGTKLIAVNDVVEQLRQQKERWEIQRVKDCIRLNLEAFDYLKRILKPGISEKEILQRLDHYVKRKGASFSFDPIVASGPNSSMPHAKITDRKIRSNEIILVDMGIEMGGYKSDLTRMFFLGKIPPHVQKAFDAVKGAQQDAIKEIKAGIPASKIDQQARKYLRKNNLDKYFGHSLGHGVGLEIHEAPKISERSEDILREGMVITIEPGVYKAKKFGIRIEDMVLVTKKGCQVLSQ